MSRLQAALIHLGISLLAFAGIVYLVMVRWYPDFLFQTDGGWQGLRILLGVDLVLGPLLTFIVYRAGKPGLRFDLSVIGIVQVSCLAAGLWIVHSERPLAIVYVDGGFFSVNAKSFDEVGAPVPDLDSMPGNHPKWVSVNVPVDLTAQSDLRQRMLGNHRMLATVSDLYVPFDPQQVERSEARPLDEIVSRDRDARATQSWLDAYGGVLSDYVFYRYGGQYSIAYLGFNAANGEFVGYLDMPAKR